MNYFVEMDKELATSIDEAVRAIETLKEKEALSFLKSMHAQIVATYHSGGKLLIAGNGGSLCDAMHFAEELTGFYREKRPPLAAIALADPGHMSCVANDTSFDAVFSRMIEAIGKKGDLFIALSTSGNSKNLVEAALKAKSLGIPVAGFLGKDGGVLKTICDLFWVVEGFLHSDRIQEAHMAAIHILIEMVENELFSASKMLSSTV